MHSYQKASSNLLSCCSFNILPSMQNKETPVRLRRNSQYQKKSLKKKCSFAQIKPLSQNDITKLRTKVAKRTKIASQSDKTIIIPELESQQQQQNFVDINTSKKFFKKHSTCKNILTTNIITTRVHQASRVQIDMFDIQDSFQAKQQIFISNTQKNLKKTHKSQYHHSQNEKNEATNHQSYQRRPTTFTDQSLVKTETDQVKGFQIVKNVEIMISNPHTIADQLKQTENMQQSIINIYDEFKSFIEKEQPLPLYSQRNHKNYFQNQKDIFYVQGQKKQGLFLNNLKIIKSQFEPTQKLYQETVSSHLISKFQNVLQVVQHCQNMDSYYNNKRSLKSKKSMRQLRQKYCTIIQHKSQSQLLENNPNFNIIQIQKKQIQHQNKNICKKRVQSMLTPQQAIKNCMFKKCLAPLSSRAKTLTSVSFGSKIQDYSEISLPISKQINKYLQLQQKK